MYVFTAIVFLWKSASKYTDPSKNQLHHQINLSLNGESMDKLKVIYVLCCIWYWWTNQWMWYLTKPALFIWIKYHLKQQRPLKNLISVKLKDMYAVLNYSCRCRRWTRDCSKIKRMFEKLWGKRQCQIWHL